MGHKYPFKTYINDEALKENATQSTKGAGDTTAININVPNISLTVTTATSTTSVSPTLSVSGDQHITSTVNPLGTNTTSSKPGNTFGMNLNKKSTDQLNLTTSSTHSLNTDPKASILTKSNSSIAALSLQMKGGGGNGSASASSQQKMETVMNTSQHSTRMTTATTATTSSTASSSTATAAAGATAPNAIDLEAFVRDWRHFECKTWHLEPTVRILYWAGKSIEPYGIDYILNKLGFSHARTTIPKWLQRGFMDPLDKVQAFIMLQLLLMIKENKQDSNAKSK